MQKRSRAEVTARRAISSLACKKEFGFQLLECAVAGSWSVHRIAARDGVTRERNYVLTGPARGFVNGIIGAEHLGAAGHHGITAGGIVGAGFLGVGVGAGA